MQSIPSNPATAGTVRRPSLPLLQLRRKLPGLLLCALLAAAATAMAQLAWFQSHGLSALTLAILLGIGIGNTVFPRIAAPCAAGVGFSKQQLLRLGIILYGFRLSFQDIGQVGIAGVAIDALVLCSTFGLALLLGRRLFRLERDTAVLIGAGSSICGAAAVLATEPVLNARADQVTVAVSTVVVFGTLSIFLYPLLYTWNLGWHVLGTSAFDFGMYAGSTIHEVAQVVAAAGALSQDAADTAVIAKMVRVMMLAPFLIGLSLYLNQRKAAAHGALAVRGGAAAGGARRITIPWFAFGFVAVCAFNSLSIVPPAVAAGAVRFDTALLTMAMAALGLSTQLSAIPRAGVKSLLLAGLLFAWLVAGGAVINRVVMGALA